MDFSNERAPYILAVLAHVIDANCVYIHKSVLKYLIIQRYYHLFCACCGGVVAKSASFCAL